MLQLEEEEEEGPAVVAREDQKLGVEEEGVEEVRRKARLDGAHGAALEEVDQEEELQEQELRGRGAKESSWFGWLVSHTDWEEEEILLEVADTYEDDVSVTSGKKRNARVHHFSCPRTLPHPQVWPTRPLLLRESRVHLGWDDLSSGKPLPTGGEVCEFETALFKGRMMFRMHTLEAAASYFEGKARLSSVVITGQFKEQLPFSEVQTGQEFCKPVRQPPSLITNAVVRFFRTLAPLLQVHVGQQTYFLSPMAQTVQTMHISDSEVELRPDTVVEENFGDTELGRPMTAIQRKKYLSKKSNLDQFAYDPSRHYTFDFYNDKLDMQDFHLRALGQRFDIQKYLKGQPLRILSRVSREGDPSDMYLWNFELWHEKVVPFLRPASPRE
ncbi:Uncharacterized protein SCF082_LOCUS42929 [Durusdinium trenchii]|uniref:Domain of unknown function at the cortex 1 domain-containing protein n=1 Tax=Durusdinium trenchii TaxID=1381693 RepID=A0ABP0QS66_9DINO